MKIRILRHIIVLTLTASIGITRAATFTVTTTASDGAGSFSQAIRDADASADAVNTIRFNIPGAGPHYLVPPVNGFPLITKDGVTVDGYSQPGSAVNTAPITETNNAVIKIVLDARTGGVSPIYRDMAYCFYGTLVTSDPPINNSSMAGLVPQGTDSGYEQGGFTPSTRIPYAIGERAILGIYRAQNVTIKGLAFLGEGQLDDSRYSIAIAQDFGLDTAIKDKFAYDNGTCRGAHIAGCWFGIDPGNPTGPRAGSDCGIAMFRHRDVGGLAANVRRPDGLVSDAENDGMPNMENFSIGVKFGTPDPRSQFNVFDDQLDGLGFEGARFNISGNQFLAGNFEGTDGGRHHDLAGKIYIGTDGDGVNDVDEGNLFQSVLGFYNTRNKLYVVAGNTINLALDGSRPAVPLSAVNQFRFDQGTKVRFGSDLNGLNDGLEANTVYDTIGISMNANAPDSNSWLLVRGNVLINNVFLPPDEAVGQNLYNKFIDTAGANPITPVITAATTASLTGTAGIPLPGVAQVGVDVYVADPEGDAVSTPQGRKYLGSFTDNGVADSNPAVGAFTFNTTSLGISSGTKITITASYLKATGGPTVTSIARSGGNTTLSISGGTGPYDILRSSTVNGTYTSFATAASSPALFADSAAMSFYRVGGAGGVGGGQTSPFASSVTVP